VPALSNLPAALFHHASSHPEEPWLFRAEGWDWRWHSWGEIARRVQAAAASLSAHPVGSHITFPYTARPDAIVQDLAIQAAGGGAVVLRNGEPVELSPADLIAMATRIQDQLAPARGREIVVLSGPLELAQERAMLSWATLAGAAVVLEPDPGLRVATAAWARPTLFHGTAAELAGLRQWVEKEKGGFLQGRPRLPFRRLRTLLVTDYEALAKEEDAFWRGRGVAVLGMSDAAISEKTIR